MTTIYLAKYSDSMYPEDNEIFAAYLTPEEAQMRCNAERLQYSHSPHMHLAKEYFYSVEALVLYDGDY